MSFVGSNILAGASGQGGSGFQIERSLRFNSGDSAHLKRTFGSGNRKTWTLSFWVKGASKYSDNRPLMTYGTASNADYFDIKFTAAGALQMSNYSSYYINTTALFRDPSAWYHFVIAVDTTQSTPADRVKLYVNGVETTRGGSDPTSGQEFGINNNQLHVLGTYANASGGGLAGSNFYLADYHFIDGQALAQTDFGEYDNNGVWQPKEFAGSYSTADQAGTSSPYVYTDFDTTPNSESNVLYLNSNPDSSSYPLIQSSVSTNNTIRVKFASAQTGVTSIKFKGGGYSSTSTYNLFVNGTQIGGSHGTNSGWAEDSHTISSTDITEIKIVGSDGFAVGQLKFNDTLVSGTPSYGTSGTGLNSFHLDFSDNSSNDALGTDSGGNSNDWTVNNLSIGSTWNQSQTWSNQVTGTNYSGYPKTQAFNNNDANYCLAGDGQEIVFTPSPSFSNATTVKIWYYAPTLGINDAIKINGTGVANNVATSGTVATHTFTVSGFTSLSWSRGGTSPNNYDVGIARIDVDGIQLVDPGITNPVSASDIDSLIDTPTNYEAGSGNNGGNYATLNPLHQLATATLANGNLQTTSSNPAFSTFLLKSGKWYCEHTVTATGYNLCFSQIDHPSGATPSSSNSKSIGWYVNGSTYWGPDYAVNSPASYAIGDVLGAGIDMDNSTIKLYKNGSLVNTIDFSTGTYHRFTDGMYISQFNGTGHFNFGQRPFAISSVPTGYKSLCTTNLPDPTIADGSTAMNVALYDGNGSTNSITGLGFSPDLLLLKNKSASGFGALANTVVGPNYFLRTNDTNALSGPGYNDDIVSFDSDGFTLGADTYYAFCNVSSNSYVAWAWDAGTSNTSISAGSLNSSVYDQSRTWSGGTSSGTMYSGAWTQVFNNVETNTYNDGNSVYVYQNTATLNFSPALPTGAIQIWGRAGSSSASGDKVTFSDGTNTYTTGDLSNQTAQWIDVESGNSLSGITSVTVHSGGSSGAGMVLGAIRVGSKKLVNSSVSVSTPSIASTVRANPSIGFSIVKASVAASLTGGPTLAHGLNKKPEFIIGKNLDSTIYWYAYHKDLSDSHYLIPHLPDSQQNSGAVWGTHDSLDSSIFRIGTGTPASMWIPSGTNDCIFFAWTGVEGYSAFGSYEGNGSTDGPFVYTGHKSRFVMYKNIDAAGGWQIYDSARSSSNVADERLQWNNGSAEDTTVGIDILSNGFKLRTTHSRSNASGNTYIWASFAENPFKTSRAR